MTDGQSQEHHEHGLSRRDVLKRGGWTFLAAGAAAAGGAMLYDRQGDAGLQKPEPIKLRNYFAEIELSPSMPRISVASGPEDKIAQMVRSAVSGLHPGKGAKHFFNRNDVVMVKPNVGFDRAPSMGATTNPEVLREVLRMLRETGVRKVMVADNPIESPAACFSKSKIQEVAEEEGAEVFLPAQVLFQTLAVRNRDLDPRRGEVLKQWPIFYKPLEMATKVVGIAPIKDHNLCSASMTMKNWYGLLGGRRNQFHQAIHYIVSDLGYMMSPTMVIADATRVMMKNGPTGGRLDDVKIGGEMGRPTVVASIDSLASDAWCYQHLLGRDPARLKYLELAETKIQEAIAGGAHRLGSRDWQALDRQGLIRQVSV